MTHNTTGENWQIKSVIGELKQTLCFSDDEAEDGNSPSDSEFNPNNKKEVKLFPVCSLTVDVHFISVYIFNIKSEQKSSSGTLLEN